jgi:hypothetical protein
LWVSDLFSNKAVAFFLHSEGASLLLFLIKNHLIFTSYFSFPAKETGLALFLTRSAVTALTLQRAYPNQGFAKGRRGECQDGG